MATHEEELRTDFTGDSTGLEKAAKKAGDAYEKVEDDVKQLGKTADITDADIEAMGDALAASIKDSERAQDALKKMRAEMDKLGDGAKDASKEVGKSMHSIADDASEAGKETGQEFMSNLGEAVGSGDISGIVQGTLGGLVGSLSGPLGLAAAAVGGIVALGFSKYQAAAEEAAAVSESMLTAMRERLGMMESEITEAFKLEQLKDYVKENIDMFQKITPKLKVLGINAQDYATAMFEGGDAAADMQRQLEAIVAVHGELEGPVGHQKIVYDETAKAALDILTTLREQTKEQRDANEEAEAYNDIFGQVEGKITSAAKKLKDMSETEIKVRTENLETRAKYQYGAYGGGKPYSASSQVGKDAGMAPPAGGQGAAYITHNWHVNITSRTPDPAATVRAIERYARDNGRPSSVSVTT